MRDFSFLVRSLAGACAITTAIGCHGGPPPVERVALTTTPVEPPKPVVIAAPTVPPPSTPVPEVVEDVDPKPNQLALDARSALAAGELDRALRLAKLAVVEAPRRSSAWNTLGRVQLRLGDRRAALDSFDQAVEMNPMSAWAQNNLGLALLYEGRSDEAVAAFEEATDLSPETALMWNNLGMAYEHCDRIVEARQAYKRAMSLDHRGAAENFVRLEGVRSLRRTAQADVDHPDLALPEDQVVIDEGL